MYSRPKRAKKQTDANLGTEVANYSLIERLGNGAHGTCYKARQIKRKDDVICVKVCENAEHAENEKKNMVLINDLGVAPEFLFIEHLVNVSVIGMTLAYKDNIQNFLDKIYVPLDENRQPKEARKFTEITLVRVLLQCLAGLQKIHSVHVVHRDLKLDNLFVTPPYDCPRAVQLQIGDFGMSARLQLVDGKELRKEPGQPEFIIRQMVHSSPTVHKRGEHGYLEDLHQVSYMALAMSGFDMEKEIKKGKLLNFKQNLVCNPSKVLPEGSQWLAPFFEAINKQNPFAIDYESLQNVVRSLIPENGFNENLRLRKNEMTIYLE